MMTEHSHEPIVSTGMPTTTTKWPSPPTPHREQAAAVLMHGPYLEITSPQGKKQVPLGPHSLTVGRHTDNKLVIADNMASRFHCVIEPRPGGWVVRDLNSSNGTLLHGTRITTAPL